MLYFAGGQQKVKYQCKYCPYAVFNSDTPEEKKLHYNKNCLGIRKKIVTIQKEFRDRTSQQVEALNSHFIKQGPLFICAYCQKQAELLQNCTIAVAKLLHLHLYHKDKHPEIKRITTMSDIQKIISGSSSTKPIVCIKAGSAMPLSKKLQFGASVDADSKWQKPASRTLPKFVKRSISLPQSCSSDFPASSLRAKTSSTESSDSGVTVTSFKNDKSRNRFKRKTSSSSEEGQRRAKRPSLSPRIPQAYVKESSLSPETSSRESSPDVDVSFSVVRFCLI